MIKTAINSIPKSSVGAWARSVRVALKLTQEELAAMVGVPKEDVDSFERNLPVKLDSRRKLAKALWSARKAVTTVTLSEK